MPEQESRQQFEISSLAHHDARALTLATLQDFDSPALKTKKHWNSFTSSFFVSLSGAEQQLQSCGKLPIEAAAAEEKLKADLKCHRCGASSRTMPALKKHICCCFAPLNFGKEPLY